MSTLRIADAIGRVLGGRYRLVRAVGSGASAHVYVAEDVMLRRRVAVKVLRPGLADDQAFLRRFRAEAQTVAALRHPHILHVYDWGEDETSPYLVSELLEGGSLCSLLDAKHLLTPSQATAVGLAAADALDYAHRRGLVHRDIKPANLLFDEEGRLSVADFGLARALAEASLTEPSGALIGTARYAAPEQLRGEVLDSRADVYALALVLTEATSGVVPFAVDTPLGTRMARISQPLQVPASAGPLVPILEAAGTIDPADRLDAAGLVRQLESLARTLPSPGPLPLAGPLLTGDAERDVNPTSLAGRVGRPGPPPSPGAALEVLLDPEAAEAGGLPGLVRQPPAVRIDPWTGSLAGDSTASYQRTELIGTEDPAVADLAGAEPADLEPAGPEGGAGEPWPGDEEPRDDHPWDEAADQLAIGLVGPPEAAPVGDSPEPGVAGIGPVRARRRWVVPTVMALSVAVVAAAAGAWIVTHRPAPLVAVPQLRGDTMPQARRVLAGDHLRLAVAGRAYDAKAPKGTITGQAPGRGRVREHQAIAVTFSRGPQPVAVPSLIDLTESTAQRLLEVAGLRLGKVSSDTSITVPTGEIIGASPSKGTLLPGQAVAIVISTGKPTEKVPLLTGDQVTSYANAAAALTAAHFVPVEEQVYSTDVPPGEVVVTSPGPGASSLYGAQVVVEVSKGPDLVRVPDVKGDTVSAADQALSAAGFTVSGVTGNPNGKVTSTDPPADQSVLVGSSVQLRTGH